MMAANKARQISVRFNEDEHTLLEAAAGFLGTSKYSLIQTLVRAWLSQGVATAALGKAIGNVTDGSSRLVDAGAVGGFQSLKKTSAPQIVKEASENPQNGAEISGESSSTIKDISSSSVVSLVKESGTPGELSLTDWAHQRWEKVKGKKPSWVVADYVSLARSQNGISPDEFKAAWARFLNDDSDYYRGHNPRKFAMDLDRWRVGRQASGDPGTPAAEDGSDEWYVYNQAFRNEAARLGRAKENKDIPQRDLNQKALRTLEKRGIFPPGGKP